MAFIQSDSWDLSPLSFFSAECPHHQCYQYLLKATMCLYGGLGGDTDDEDMAPTQEKHWLRHYNSLWEAA